MNKTIFVFLISLLLTFNVGKAQTKVINVYPNNGISNADLAKALEDAGKLNGKPVVINLQLGTYYFSRGESVKQIYYISNTSSEKENPDQTKHIGLLLKNLKNVIVEGNGSTIIMTGEMTSFIIDECENITFRNLNFDYLHPTQTEIKILEEDDKYLIAQVHPTSQYRIDNEKLVWFGDGWSFSKGIAQAYDYEKDITWRSWSPMSNLMKTTDIGDNKIRMEYSEKPKAGIGLVYQMRDAIRDEVCGLIHKSKDVTFENVNFYYLGNFGVVGQYSDNITLDNITFAPEIGSGRTNAGFADFIQISGCKGVIDIKNSRFTGAHDDPINIHGTHFQVIEFISSKEVKVRFMHHQSYGFDAFFENDEIEFIDTHSLLSLNAACVASVKKISPREIILTVDKDLPKSILSHKQLVVENVTWTPEVKITNNFFSRIPTRGVLVTTRRKVLIENNTFFRTQMSGILIANDALSWYESGMVKEVVIRNNYFVECGTPVIYIAPENSTHKGYVHQNIKIENNKFKLKDNISPVVRAKSVDGLYVTNNLFIVPKALEMEKDTFVKTTDCKNVVFTNNRTEKLKE